MTSENSSARQEPIIAEVEGNIEREVKGWNNLGETKLICSACDKELINIVKVKDEEITRSYVAVCPCGDKSFKKTLTGKVIYGPVSEDLSIVEVVTECGLVKILVE